MRHTVNIIEDNLAQKLNDSSIDQVMAIDTGWTIIAWNKTSELLSGFSKNDVMGKHLLEVFPLIKDDEEMIAAITSAFMGRKTFLYSNPAYFHRKHIENHFIPLMNDDQTVMGVMNIMHDVAHRVKAEKQLELLNTALEKKYVQLQTANNDLAKFTYIASREIQEPIRNVYMAIEFLARKEGHQLSNMSRGSLRKMQASLSRMNLLLDDLLAVSRINNNPDHTSTVDLNTVLENVRLKMTQKLQDKNSALNIGELPLVRGSAEMLGYLFQHLIDNAIKFQQEGNRPVVDIYCEQFEKEDMPETEHYYVVVVRDNGIGFEQKDGEVIFDMFTTLQQQPYRGSGIGLAVCKRIMDSHEGKITAESVPGKGSTFKCYFPARFG